MNNYIIPNRLMSTILLMVMTLAHFAWGQEMKKGAFILISLEGTVTFLDDQGKKASAVAVGQSIPASYQLETGEDGKLVGLLSNGTLLTLVEKTKMKVATFEQQPFEAGDKKLADLQGEPSKSKVSIDLEFGSLVVKTKKLNKGSMFDINSPVGVAGIRGTEFQMASNPGQGVQLDVTESTVAFAPPGGGAPVEVSQGGGLSVSPSGVATTRPVNPSVAQNIQSTNQAATEATNDVSLGEVTAAMDQASAESESSEEQSSEESSEDSEEESTDETEESSEESPEEADSSDSDSEETESGSDSEGSSETDAMEDKQASSDSDGGEAGSAAPEAANSPVQAEANIDAVLETNADAKQTRKTGESGASAGEIARLGLNAEQMEKFFNLPTSLQANLKEESPVNVRRFIDLSGMSVVNLETYFGYSPETRKKIVYLEDVMMISLLDKAYDEEILESLLTQENLANSKSSNTPGEGPDDVRITQLGDTLRASGNGAVFDEISEMNQGEWTDEWIELAEIANHLTQDYDLSNADVWQRWESLGGIDGGDALENPFFEQVSATYGELDHSTYGLVEDHTTIGGASISMGSGTYDLGDFLVKNNDLLIGATDTFSLSGNIQFESDDPATTRVVVMSGASLAAAEGLNLQSAISDFVISAREDVLLKNASVDALNKLAVQSLRDVTLENATLTASQQMMIKAARDLNVDGLQISQNLPSMIMEATTIRLRNIDFPSVTQVQLNSLKGPIDGSYPNFGSVSASEQLGRVNFIENVKSGGNLMNDRPTFDTYGTNIQIGKISNP